MERTTQRVVRKLGLENEMEDRMSVYEFRCLLLLFVLVTASDIVLVLL